VYVQTVNVKWAGNARKRPGPGTGGKAPMQEQEYPPVIPALVSIPGETLYAILVNMLRAEDDYDMDAVSALNSAISDLWHVSFGAMYEADDELNVPGRDYRAPLYVRAEEDAKLASAA
jgi:hypothetical protein